ncbi:ATP-dependent DNA helicase PIF1-like, partial [Olea europaea subsp. europaea]
RNVILVEITTGEYRGKQVFLPRIPFIPLKTDRTTIPFKRTQFSIRLCFAMTINKAQSRTLDFVGLYLLEPVFYHGQLYVALSRANTSRSTKVLLKLKFYSNRPMKIIRTTYMLPTSFINYWELEIGNTLRLTAYGAIIVTVQLERIDGEIYLANGWEEFFDHHNLQDGYVVVFESNGNLMLNMRIFDRSRAEITYGSNYEVDDDDLNMDNPAFEVKLTLDHNNHREIVCVIFNTSCCLYHEGLQNTIFQDMCKMFEFSTLYFTTRISL